MAKQLCPLQARLTSSSFCSFSCCNSQHYITYENAAGGGSSSSRYNTVRVARYTLPLPGFDPQHLHLAQGMHDSFFFSCKEAVADSEQRMHE
jgi:hypothetical protein